MSISFDGYRRWRDLSPVGNVPAYDRPGVRTASRRPRMRSAPRHEIRRSSLSATAGHGGSTPPPVPKRTYREPEPPPAGPGKPHHGGSPVWLWGVIAAGLVLALVLVVVVFLPSDAGRKPATSPALHKPVVTIENIHTSDSTPALHGTVRPKNAMVRIAVNSRVYEASTHGNGTWTLADDRLPPLEEGEHEAIVVATHPKQKDLRSRAEVGTIKIDRTAPKVTAPPVSTDQGSPSISGHVDEPYPEMEVIIAGKVYKPYRHVDGRWEIPAGRIQPPLEPGVHRVLVTATDAAGNVGHTETQIQCTGAP